MSHIDLLNSVVTNSQRLNIRPLMSTETQTTDEQNRIPSTVLADLREAGASELFIDVITTPTSEIPGVERNSARVEVQKYIDWAKDSDKEVTDYLNYGGHFFQSLFDGEPRGADSNNQRILDFVRDDTDERNGLLV